MSEIVLVGVNHESAPVEIRECLAFSPDESGDVLTLLLDSPSIEEVVVLSTCNRVEILAVADHAETAEANIKTFISDYKQQPIQGFESMVYTYAGDNAVRHIFKVASSLNSMVVGEPQILGQVKEAYRTATQSKSSGVILNRLMHRAFFVAKRVRTETGIGDHAVSISYAAIELGKKIFGSLDGKKVLLIGAGEMAELAVEHLVRNRVGDIYVANRTFERGVELARRFHGKPVRFEEIQDCLKLVDIIISSTGASGFVIEKDAVKGVFRKRKNRPLFFIDIAVPRDIDPEVNRLENTYVYDIDDLNGVIEENIEDRRHEAVKGERIVEEAVIQFRKWLGSLDVVPTIVSLRNKIERIVRNELGKSLQSVKNLSDDDRKALDQMVDAMVRKIMHSPTMFLKSDGCMKDRSEYLDMTRKLFNLDERNQRTHRKQRSIDS